MYRWIREEHQRVLVAQAELATGAFILLQLQAAPVVEGVAKPALTQARVDTDSADIRIEVRRGTGTGTVTVNYPLEGAASCTAWLAVAPLDMGVGTDTALAWVAAVFGAAHPNHAYARSTEEAIEQRG